MNPPLVLLVDNEKRTIELMTIALELDGFGVDIAYGGEIAIEKMKDKRYSAVIVDFGLPDMKGDELAERIRKEDPEIGIILLTGFKPGIDPVRLGAFDTVFEKPVVPNKILEAVRKLTEPKKNKG